NKNINKIENAFNRFKDMLKDKGFYGKTAYVHTFQVPIMKSLGFNIAGTFGPAPVNAEKIQEVSGLKPDFIIDNVHNEVAQPLLEESPDSLYVSFLNFPGLFNTETLLDVIKYNEEALKKTVTNK
ncbi:MAG: hypothetical protein ACOCV8_04885, partial [Spirochaetota bacterium]